MGSEAILVMENITKEFPGVKALDNVRFELRQGEILAVLGENGAGKSTLLKILSGAYKRDFGNILLDGKVVDFKSPYEAIKAGIAIIYQELNYVGSLTVAENIFLERQPTKGFLKRIDWNRMFHDSEVLLNQLGLNINPVAAMESLSVAEKQLVEITKAISHDMKILITDEPTSALSVNEVKKLFDVMKRLKTQQVSVIFISHRIEEVMEISDRVLILRDGRNVGVVETAATDKDALISLMVGKELRHMYPKKVNIPGSVLLEVKELSSKVIKDINFTLHKGEIIGLFGLLGSGISEVGEVLFGNRGFDRGEIKVRDKNGKIRTPSDAILAGITFVPSDRRNDGLVLGMNLTENVCLANLLVSGHNVLLNHRNDREKTRLWVERLWIKTPDIDTIVGTLSGGNQQKIVLSKWLDVKPEILILCEPTRGIDVGAKAEIYALMEELCESGVGIILISSELPEVLAMADVIVVMKDGCIVGQLVQKDADAEKVMQLALGGSRRGEMAV